MTTVIYHSADFDGIFCREIARKFVPGANLVGWNFGDEPLKIPTAPIYVFDLPLDEVFGFKYKIGDSHGPQHPYGLVWIDHHKTSIDTHPKDIPGYRIDGVAACRLAWQWFTHPTNKTPRRAPDGSALLPLKEEFVARKLSEPLAVRLAGEYDIWDKRDPDAETFQYGLRLSDELDWDILLGSEDSSYLRALLNNGRIAQSYAQRNNASICKSNTWLMDWEGLKFLCVNTARFNSLLFAERDKPETGHDALLGFCYNGKVWTVSLYHANHRKDIDLSEIAKRYGGGGHKGACGFTASKLPFNLT